MTETQPDGFDRYVAVTLDTDTGAVYPNQQLIELARRFPDQYIEQKDGQSYVAHHIVIQRLLSVVGPFDFQLVEVLRSDLPAVPGDPQGRSRRAKQGTPALHQVVTGAVWRLTCEIDGRRTTVEEVGDTDPHNWSTDGARLKDAASDALKRCAMRVGLGAHLWAQEHYFLDRQLAKAVQPEPRRPEASAPVSPPAQSPRSAEEPRGRVTHARGRRPAWEQGQEVRQDGRQS
jgi:hypothetical protein